MFLIMDALSMGSGGYIFSLPLVIILLAYTYGEKREEGILKTLRTITLVIFMWGSYIFQDGITIYLSMITWVLVVIPLSFVIVNLISKNLSSTKFNIKQLDILGIPRKVIITHLALLIIACSLIISDTMMNRTTVLESYHSFIEEMSESNNPEVVLMSEALNPYSLLLGVIDKSELIKGGEISTSFSSPWKIKVIALIEDSTEKVKWEFFYIRYYGEWKLDGKYTIKYVTELK